MTEHKQRMHQLVPRVADALVTAGLLLIVALAGNYLARSVWLMLEPAPVVTAHVNWDDTVSTRTQDDLSIEERARRIADTHWFGEVAPEQTAAEPVTVQPVTMPETRLQLELRGVMAGDTPTEGSAMIAQRNNTSALFRIGETIFNQAELLEVYGDRVVISRNGELETLSFEPPEDNASASTNAGSAQGTGGSSDTSVAQAPTRQRNSSNSSNNARTASPQARSATPQAPQRSSADAAQQRLEEELRQALTEVQARAKTDPDSLLRQYGLEPTDNGYRVTPRAGILIANGLRPGDRITRINDQPVGNVDRDQALVDSVLASDQIKITLERSGATYTFYQSLPGL